LVVELKIEIVNPTYYKDWDDLLLTNDQSTFFQTSAWARVLADSYSYKPLYFTIFDNRKISALIPIMQINSFLTGKRGVSLPFTDECPSIASNAKQHEALIETIIQYGKSAGWTHFELRGGNDYLADETPAATFYTHHINLIEGESKIFSAFRNSNKRNIRRAGKKNVTVELCHSSDALKEFYRMNVATRRRHGLPPQPYNFFKKIYDHIVSKKKGIVVLAKFQEKIVAGAIYLLFGDNVIYKYGASDTNYLKMRPNNFVMWQAIKWCIGNGFQRFSLGRTEPDHDGLLQFKRGWGAKEDIVKYYKYDLTSHSFVAENQAMKSSYKCFKIMPLAILRLTGNLLYRHVG